MSNRYPYHLKRADVILESMRRYPACESDRDRADMAFDRELLAQHLADIEGAAADQPAAETALSAADRLAQKVMALRADQNSWPKEEEVYEAMVAYRELRVAETAPASASKP